MPGILLSLLMPTGVSRLSFEAITLTHCLGTGTFGAVVAGKFDDKFVAVKLPKVHTSTGGNFYSSAELSPLSALPKDSEERRNVVQMYGTVKVPLTWIAEKGPTKDFRKCINASAYIGATSGVPAIVLEQTSRHRLRDLMSDVRLPVSVHSSIRKSTGDERKAMLAAQAKHFRGVMVAAKKSNHISAGPLRMFTSPDSSAAWDILSGVAHGMHLIHRRGVVHRGMYPPGEFFYQPSSFTHDPKR